MTCPVERMVCWTSVLRHMHCGHVAPGLPRLALLIVPVLCIIMCVFWCDSQWPDFPWPEFLAVLRHHILMTVLCVHLSHVHLLMLTLQCPTFSLLLALHTHAQLFPFHTLHSPPFGDCVKLQGLGRTPLSVSIESQFGCGGCQV